MKKRFLTLHPKVVRPMSLDQLLLVYTGYSLNPNAAPQYQFWEPHEFAPLLAHIDRATGWMDGRMFTDFLFLALGILDEQGNGRYLARNETAPAAPKDWDRYLQELFACDRNLHALCQATAVTPFPSPRVWIALPYPNPQLFASDEQRIAAVMDWVYRFWERWTASGLWRCLELTGFYWLQESLYYQGPVYDDRVVIRAINRNIHQLVHTGGNRLQTLWIPYQLATGRSEWRSLGFDVAFLQPNYYFNPERKLETAAVEAYQAGQGLVMEVDLAVTYDPVRRQRFIEYMNLGATGGYDAAGQNFPPYMLTSPLAWYTGGWYLGKNGRKQALISLYQTNDPLYDQIYAFIQGSYVPLPTT